MLTITQRIADAPTVQGQLTLPFDLRCRSRLRAQLDDGREAALYLSRGEVLRGGDLLRAEDGAVIRVVAAPERVSTATAPDSLLLSRACYHLGNRHVALQVGPGWLRYLHDHVLDVMVRALGLAVVDEQAPFEPEPGAYAAGHSHGHGDHGYSHDSSLDHGPGQGDGGQAHGAHAHSHTHGHGH